MKNQKVIIISIVSIMLLTAMVAVSVLLNNQTKAASACNHTFGPWTNTGVGLHVRTCTKCGSSESQNCDDYYQAEYLNEKQHYTKVCSVCGSVTGPVENHKWDENGRCTTVGCRYQCKHTEIKDGKCTNCGKVQECPHTVTYYEFNRQFHWKVCSNCKKEWTEERHTFNSEGVCTTCEYHCQHETYRNGKCVDCGEQCSHIRWTEYKDENYHWKECLTCEQKFDEERHVYRNGVCVECNYQCKHSRYRDGRCVECGMECSHRAWSNYYDADYHWKKCAMCGEEFAKEKHTFRDGVCTECSYGCTHGDVEWKQNETEHWQICKICLTEIPGSRKAHTVSSWKDEKDGTHTGTCSVCGRNIKESHTFVDNKCKCGAVKECEHETKVWNHNEREHWQTCKDCNKEIEGTRGTHIFINGVCTVCTYSCSHENKVWKQSAEEHWQVCSNCSKEIEGTRTTHTFENGVCKTCGYSCKHSSKTWKRDETEHWQECKVCLMEIAGTRTAHTLTSWEKLDEKNHTATCTVCNKIVKEEHKFEDGKCKCGFEEKVEKPECKHEKLVWKTSATEHWKECENCGKEIEGTRENHAFENGVCKTCAYSCEHAEIKWLAISKEHWRVCRNCGMEIPETRERHTFKDGVCTTCNYTCKHTKEVWKSNETEHWKECENCLMVFEETRGEHKFEDGKCTVCLKAENEENSNNGENNNQSNENNGENNNQNNNENNSNENNNNNVENNNPSNAGNKDNSSSKQDETTSKKEIPNTGRENMAIILTSAVAVVGAAVVKFKIKK